jgi:inhibitor of KinA
MHLVPLGDAAILAYLPDEPAAVRFAAAVRAANPPWLEDVVPAYASAGVFFDADRTRTSDVLRWLEALAVPVGEAAVGRAFVIPVCYEMQLDLARVCEHTGLSADDAIRLHTATEYTIHAIGFVPGFPYMGYLPSALRGVSRLASPRVRVEPGSVGLTGRQTGIYPLARPGGWNLIGRTPLVIVDVADDFFPLRVGDCVRFERISESRYRELEGERLSGESLARE